MFYLKGKEKEEWKILLTTKGWTIFTINFSSLLSRFTLLSCVYSSIIVRIIGEHHNMSGSCRKNTVVCGCECAGKIIWDSKLPSQLNIWAGLTRSELFPWNHLLQLGFDNLADSLGKVPVLFMASPPCVSGRPFSTTHSFVVLFSGLLVPQDMAWCYKSHSAHSVS